MDYTEALTALGALVKTVASGARRLTWNLSRQTLDDIQRRAAARIETMKEESEPFRRMGKAEHDRVRREIMAEEKAAGQQSAGVARAQLEPRVLELDRQYRDLITQTRQDTALSFPEALDGFRPVDMLQVSAFRETRRSAIETASVADLLRIAERAIKAQDAAGFVDFQLVEERVGRGPVSKQAGDLPTVAKLNLLLGETSELRIPYSLEEMKDIEDTITLARKAVSHCDLIPIRPINIDQPANAAAKRAFEAEANEYRAAIEAAAGAEA